MPDNVASTNGWPEYKMTVIQQLEYLTSEVKEVRAAIGGIEKDIASLVTRDRLEADIISVNAKREAEITSLHTKRELDLASINKRRDDSTIILSNKINENLLEFKKLETEFTAYQSQEERKRKAWGILITCVAITINIAGLIAALILIR